LTYASS
jgi:hypothetical protein